MGGSVAHDAVAEAPGATLELQRHSMLTGTEKGERLDAEMRSINLFSDVVWDSANFDYHRLSA